MLPDEFAACLLPRELHQECGLVDVGTCAIDGLSRFGVSSWIGWPGDACIARRTTCFCAAEEQANKTLRSFNAPMNPHHCSACAQQA